MLGNHGAIPLLDLTIDSQIEFTWPSTVIDLSDSQGDGNYDENVIINPPVVLGEKRKFSGMHLSSGAVIDVSDRRAMSSSSSSLHPPYRNPPVVLGTKSSFGDEKRPCSSSSAVIDLYMPALSTSSSSSSSSILPVSRTTDSGRDLAPEIQVIGHITPLQEILSVFPDAKVDAVKAILSRRGSNASSIASIIDEMLEKGYEKRSKFDLSKELDKRVDFKSTGWTVSEKYKVNAIQQLQNDFPFLKVESIRSLLEKYKQHYTPARLAIEKTVGRKAYDYSVSSLGALRFIRSGSSSFDAQNAKPLSIAELDAMKPGLIELGLSSKKTMSKYMPIVDMDEIFKLEMAEFSEASRKEQEGADRDFASKLNEELAEEDGALIECECCYSEQTFENLVQCTLGHLFCKNCLQRYVEQSLFGDGKTVIKCMCTTENCTGVFSEFMLRMSLPEKVYSNYQEAAARDAVKAAKIDLVSCFKCQYQVEFHESAGSVLTCPQCTGSTCRLCGEESHIPLKCSEVEKKAQTDKRLSVEEAMTNARVRQCPKCKSRFYKVEGCNKMTCSCGFKLCYVCRKDVNKEQYKHFCQTAHCNHKTCGKCRLFSDSVVDDIQAMKEIGLKTLREVSDENDEDDVDIDVNKLLETKPSDPAKAQAPQGGAGVIPGAMAFLGNLMRRGGGGGRGRGRERR